MPFLIVGFHRKVAVIILTGGGDLGHVEGSGYESRGYGAAEKGGLVIPRAPPAPVILNGLQEQCNRCLKMEI